MTAIDAIELTDSICVALDHPSIAGHFPGDPIVPGVILIDHIAALLERNACGSLRRLGAIKFVAPLRPGEIAVANVRIDGARVRFRVARGEQAIMSGDAELAVTSKAEEGNA
ncbi:MAG: hypothetical protein ABI451_03685 [Dokdonella sp.]